MAETYNNDGTPNKTNHRAAASKIMEAAAAEVPWFGIEQEYTLMGLDGRPFGWPAGGFPGPQGPYYCGAGMFISSPSPIYISHRQPSPSCELVSLIRLSLSRCREGVRS